MIIVGHITYRGSKNTIEQKVGFYSQEIVAQETDKIDNKLQEFEKSTMMLISDQEFNNLLSTEEYDNDFEKMR